MADTKLVGKQYRSKPLKKVLAASNAGIAAEVTRADAAFITKAGPVLTTEAVSIAMNGTGAAAVDTAVSFLTYTGNTGTANVTLAVPGTIGKLKILSAVAGVDPTQNANKTLLVASTNLLPAVALSFKSPGDYAILVATSASKWFVVAKKETPSA